MGQLFPFRSIADLARFGQAVGNFPLLEKAALKVFGYPEFAFTVDTLSPDQQRDINALATRIVASQPTLRPIRAVSIFGFADVDLREAPSKRAQTEQEVSSDRATAAQEALKDAIRKQGDVAVLGKIHMTSKGFGSAFREVVPKPGQSLTEAEMRRNRRVEFFITEVILPPPTPKEPDKPKQPEVGTVWTGQILSGSVASEGLTIVSAMTVTLEIEIVDITRKLKARFFVVALGQGLPGVAAGPFGLSLTPTATLTAGSAVPFTTFKTTRLDSFAGRVAILVDPGGAASSKSTDSFYRIGFEGMEQTVFITPKPNPVPLSAGTSLTTLPQVGLGGVVHGPLVMRGKPAPL